MRYFLQTTQIRADGDVNYPTKKEFYTDKTAWAGFYSAVSSAYSDTTYSQIAVALFDATLNQLGHKIVDTSYVAPTTTGAESES